MTTATAITYPMQIKQSILELGAAFEIGSTRWSVVGLEPNLVLRSTVRGRKRKHRQLEQKARQADMAFLVKEDDEETAALMQCIVKHHQERLRLDSGPDEKVQDETEKGCGHDYDYDHDPDDSVLIEIPPGKVCNVADDEPDNPFAARTPVLYLRNDHYQVCVQRPDPLLRVSEDLPKYQLPQLWNSKESECLASDGRRLFVPHTTASVMAVFDLEGSLLWICPTPAPLHCLLSESEHVMLGIQNNPPFLWRFSLVDLGDAASASLCHRRSAYFGCMAIHQSVVHVWQSPGLGEAQNSGRGRRLLQLPKLQYVRHDTQPNEDHCHGKASGWCVTSSPDGKRFRVIERLCSDVHGVPPNLDSTFVSALAHTSHKNIFCALEAKCVISCALDFPTGARSTSTRHSMEWLQPAIASSCCSAPKAA